VGVRIIGTEGGPYTSGGKKVMYGIRLENAAAVIHTRKVVRDGGENTRQLIGNVKADLKFIDIH